MAGLLELAVDDVGEVMRFVGLRKGWRYLFQETSSGIRA